MKKYTDIIGGAAVFLLAAVYFVMAFQIKQFGAGQAGIITSDFMPKLYGAAVMILSAIQILRGIINLKKGRTAEEPAAKDGEKKRLIQPEIPLTFLLLVVYVGLLPSVGFVIMSPLFVLGLAALLLPPEQRCPKTYLLSFAVGVVFSIAVALIFVKGFSLTLPMGILG